MTRGKSDQQRQKSNELMPLKNKFSQWPADAGGAEV
jgi:hypothetical protein